MVSINRYQLLTITLASGSFCFVSGFIMARKSGRNSPKKINLRGVPSKSFYRKDKIQSRRRHKFKSHSHRLALLKKYFPESETRSNCPESKSNSPIYKFSTDIPDIYQESYICALPINPDFLFTYWELAPDYVAEKVKEAETGLNLFLRIRAKTFLENDFQIDQSETDAVSSFIKPEEDINYQISNTTGDMVIEIPDTEDVYVMEMIHKTESGDDILLVSHEIINTFSHNSEAILYCNDDLIDANEYFDGKEECNQEKKTKVSLVELDYKLCTDYRQYLGSASYEN